MNSPIANNNLPQTTTCRLGSLSLCILAVFMAGCQFSPPVRGLRPIYPEVRYKPGGTGVFSSEKPATSFVEINTLEPTMAWETFPTKADQEEDKAHLLEHIEQVGYDLKIWRVEQGAPSELVYERENLPTPSHKLAKPLAPDTQYCWSVRARFKINGERRLGEWGFSKYPWLPQYNHEYGASPRRTDNIPYANYYRFRTPGR